MTLAGQVFSAGWIVVESGDASWLDITIRSLGWNSNVLTRLHSKTGFGSRAQDAIRRAAHLALRKVNKRFNAAKVTSVVLTKRLWFYHAIVGIVFRSIQESPFMGTCAELSTSLGPMTFEARHQHP
jgi:hypothetical protein